MKIEVTFDKSAKKQFRDQCIQRLQNFVTQMKGKANTPNTRRNSILSALEESSNSTARENASSHVQQHHHNSTRHQRVDEKSFKKQIVLNTKAIPPSPSAKLSAKQNDAEQGRASEQANAKEKFDLSEMRQKVNQILQKLDKSECLQQVSSENIDQKLQLTNRKLDYLIECIEKKGITSGILNKKHQEEEHLPSSFEQKFNHLTDQYYQIRQRSAKAYNHVPIFSKSATSLEQTQDSVTFRRN